MTEKPAGPAPAQSSTSKVGSGNISSAPKTPAQTRLFLKTKLRELEGNIADAQAEISKQQKQADKLMQDKSALDTSYQEIDQALTEFEQSYDDLICELEKLEKYAARRTTDFEESLREGTRRSIRDIRNQVDGDIGTRQGAVDRLGRQEAVNPADNTTVQRAQNYLDNCLLVLADKQRAYDDEKNAVTSLQASIQVLTDLTGTIDGEVEQGNTRNAYALFLDMEEQVQAVRNKLDQYETTPPSDSLCEAWRALYDAQEVVRRAEDSLSQRTQELETANAELTALQGSRISDIFDKIRAEAAA